MKSSQSVMDRMAIGLSVMCTVHCFATPVILALLPSFAVMQIDSEQFHLWILTAVMPTSLLALSLGCKKHKLMRYMACGVIGLAFMICAVLLGHEIAEKALTLIGSAFIAVAHWFNYQQCLKQNDEKCPCSGSKLDQMV
ncbi:MULTISPECIES: MerC domain-containing protein [unclassified Pseudoalteromonas]|uniref:MerC domain-containing protein n=1 Tax=unclassified Pseudoalteromonas TaxID=194690 RepID=UPI0013FD8960|nr:MULTISPECIES: MerC domain-containing protein [unclassified Pseudoalteromonas]MBH0032086.1 MerC domain-containing protein [Pseudoalteromonas sp. SWYJZ98]